MRKVVLFCLDKVSYIISFLFSYNRNRYIKFFLNRVYSFSVKRNLKKCGKNFSIERPVYLYGAKYIEIGDNFNCFERLRLEAFERHNNNAYSPSIKIGNNVSLNYNCHIGCINSITIKDGVLLASNVFITDQLIS